MSTGILPPPTVPAAVYDEAYYLNACAGHAEWTASGGAKAAGIYHFALSRGSLEAGSVLVDIGCGRGELVAMAAERGARAIGIEYSSSAVSLAHRTLDAHGMSERARVVEADARAIPLEDDSADLVTLLDVVEHLAPSELACTLGEAFRILRRGGGILIHTAPTRTLYEVTYRLQRMLSPGRRRSWPADPRNELERVMHVNEQTIGSLRAALRRAGFRHVRVEPGHWMHLEFLPDEGARRLYWRLASKRMLRRFGVADLIGEAKRPA